MYERERERILQFSRDKGMIKFSNILKIRLKIEFG